MAAQISLLTEPFMADGTFEWLQEISIVFSGNARMRNTDLLLAVLLPVRFQIREDRKHLLTVLALDARGEPLSLPSSSHGTCLP